MSEVAVFSSLWLKIGIMVVCGLYFVLYYIMKEDDGR